MTSTDALRRVNVQLDRARNHLRYCQRRLHAVRRLGNYYPTVFHAAVVYDFYLALDRVWELQCMVHGVFGDRR